MIDVDGIRDVFKKCGLYDKESAKNFIIKCPYCGDKSDKFGSHKHSHCYVSKVDSVPVFNCFYCQKSGTIQKLLFDLTGDKCDNLIIPVNNPDYVQKKTVHNVLYSIPEIDTSYFPLKTLYMRRRTFGKLDITTDIPNLIFDIKQFFQINNLDYRKYVNDWFLNYIQDNMVVFLSKRQTMLYCRSVTDNCQIKFKKIQLDTNECVGLDYYCIDNGHPKSNTVVLSEGNFDILGCFAFNTLNVNDSARAYAAGCTFSYEELLKSVCMDYSIYRANVIVLSDSDKNYNNYKFFIKNSNFYVDNMNIYYNQYGKDFGMCPQKAVKLF